MEKTEADRKLEKLLLEQFLEIFKVSLLKNMDNPRSGSYNESVTDILMTCGNVLRNPAYISVTLRSASTKLGLLEETQAYLQKDHDQEESALKEALKGDESGGVGEGRL